MDTLIENKMLDSIKRHESFRGISYTDTKGNVTIGWGRNLNANPLSRSEGEVLLLNDVSNARNEMFQFLPFTKTLDQIRQAVLVELVFNIGIEKVIGFKEMINALKDLDYKRASQEMLDSEWHKEVGSRAEDMAYIMETGIQ